MTDGFMSLPLSEEYLVLLGRQARACGGIELITKWLLRALLTPKDVKASAAKVRGMTHNAAVELIREIAPIRAEAMNPVASFHFLNNLSWLDAAREVMRVRNDYLHGFWLPADDDFPVPGFWDKYDERNPVDLPTLSAAVEKAEVIERGGVSVLRYAGECLGLSTLDL